MNYWVISPNASNDGNIDKYLGLIEEKTSVLMGWGEDAPLGKTFKNEITINDLIIIAQGSNKNKKVSYCGLVDSESSSNELSNGNITFKSQHRKLKYFTKLKMSIFKNLKFEECAYGNSSQIPAIYKLKPDENECDKRFIDIVMKELNNIKIKQILEEKTNLLKNRNQIILQGPPGTGKTRLAKQMARYMIKKEIEANIDDLTKQVKLIQFHPSYSYEDFVRGISAKTTRQGIEYIVENKILADIAQKALDHKDKIYILIIDEINRANLSSVLGELIYALEYRGEAVESMYELEENGKKTREIILPSNLYIIGTMNTADRSIGHIDYAIRRRFAFESILPDETVVNENSKFNEVKEVFKNHLSPEFNINDVMLGHSYFIAKDDEELNNKLKYQVIPLLQEYVKDGVLIDTKDLRDKIEKL